MDGRALRYLEELLSIIIEDMIQKKRLQDFLETQIKTN